MGNICTDDMKDTYPVDFCPRTPKKETSGIASSFVIKKLLSATKMSKVFLVSKKNDEKLYVMKATKKSSLKCPKVKKHAMTERKILENLNSPFLVDLHFAFQDRHYLYLVLEYMPGGDMFSLFHKRKPFPEEMAKFYIAETLLALEDLHNAEIIHRDLKLENLLIGSDGHLKLTDFNMCKMVNKERFPTRTMCGTPSYMAPETIKGCYQTYKTDFWSLGVLLYEMIEGVHPFRAKNHQLLFENILSCSFISPQIMSEDAHSLVKSLLKVCIWDRPEGHDIKQSKFFDGIDWQLLRDKAINPPYVPEEDSHFNLYTDREISKELSVQSSKACKRFKGFSYNPIYQA